MASDKRTIEVILTAKDSGYASTMKKAQDDTKKLSLAQKAAKGDLDKLGKGMAVFGAAAVAGVGAALAATARFDKEMGNVSAAVYGSADDTTEAFAQMREAARTTGREFGYTAAETAQGMNELVRAGRPAAKVVGGELSAALSLAAADAMSLEAATSIVASTMTIFEKQGLSAAQAADILAAGAGVAQGGVHELGEGLKYVGTQAAASGVGLQETVGLMATLANNGMMGSMAGTALAGVMRNLQTPTSAGAAAMEKLGVSVYDADGKFKGITPVIEDMSDKLAGLTQQERTEILSKIFDVRALNAAIPLLDAAATKTRDGTNALREMQTAVGQSGYATEQAARQLDNLAGDWTKFKAAVESAMIGASESTNSFARVAVQAATRGVDAFDKLPTGVKNTGMALTAVAGGASLMVAGLIKGAGILSSTKTALINLGMSANTASTAVKGLGIAGGVMGGALALATAGFAFYSAKVAEAQARTESYRSSVEEAANGIEGSVEKMLLTNIRDNTNMDWGWFQKVNTGAKTFAEALDKASISQADFAKAVAGSDREFEAFLATLDEMGKSDQAWQDPKYAETIREIGVKANQQRTAIEEARKAQADYAEALSETAAEQDGMADSTESATEAAAAQAEQIQDTINNLFQLRDAVSQVMAAQSGMEAAIDNAAAAVDEENRALLQNADIFNLNDPVIRSANDSLRAIADSARNYSSELVEQGAAGQMVEGQMRLAAAAIMEQGHAWDLAEEDLVRFTSQLTGLPESEVVTLTTEGVRESLAQVEELDWALAAVPPEVRTELIALFQSGALSNVDTWAGVLEGLPAEKITEIIAALQTGDIESVKAAIEEIPPEKQLDILTDLNDSGFTDANTALDALIARLAQRYSVDVSTGDSVSKVNTLKAAIDSVQSKSVTVTANYVQVGFVSSGMTATKYATGGAISGPGTGTSDSILALLSNGEHVWTANEVASAGGHEAVSRLRGMAAAGVLPRFASGGEVKVNGYALSRWQGWLATPLEITRMKIRIRDLQKKLAAGGKDRLTGLDRTEASQELAKAKNDLALANKANALNKQKSIAARIAEEDAKLEKAKDREARLERLEQTGFSFSKEARRGDYLKAVSSGQGLAKVDDMFALARSGDLSPADATRLTAAADQFEAELTDLYASIDGAKQVQAELQNIYDQVERGLSSFNLDLTTDWTEHIDNAGNVWHTKDALTGAGLASQATSQAELVKRFAGKLSDLVAAGASPALVQKIAALDPAAGIEAADAFLADSSSITTMNKALEDISTYAGAAAQYVTGASYSGGLAAADGLVAGLEKQIETVGEKMAKAFAQALGLSTVTIAGARANGGPVTAGIPYLVGERGPEIMVPSSSGYVVPNGTTTNQVTQYFFDGIEISAQSSQEQKVLEDFAKVAGRYRRAGVTR